jgi:hypothetical protein
MRTRSIGLLFLLAGLVSCGKSNTSPSDIFDGTWVGQITTNLAGVAPGTATVTLTQSGSTVSGSYSTSYPDPSNNGGGSFSGTATGTSLAGTLSPSNPNQCPYTVNATASGNQLTGTYAAFNCTISFGGSVSLTKQ